MLLRHAVQHRRSIFWRGIPAMSNSTKATNFNSSTRATKKNQKQTETSESIRSSPKSHDTRRSDRPNGQNVWNMLGRDVDESEPLPQAQDSSWKNPNKFNKEEHGPKNAHEMYKDPIYPPRLFPWVHHPVHSPTPSAPTTREELINNLVAMRNTVPAIALAQIVRYHDHYPWLQSSLSFNTVLELAVRHSAIGTARKLLRAMDAMKIPFVERTIALVTRLRVRVGHRMALRLRRRWLPQSTLGAHNRAAQGQLDTPGERIGQLFGDAMDAEVGQLQPGVSLEVLSEYLGTPHRPPAREYREAYLGSYRRDVRKVSNFEILLRNKRKRRRVFLPKLTLASVPPQPSNPLSAYEIISMDYEALASRPTKDFAPRTPPLSSTLASRLAAKVHPAQNPETVHRLSLLMVRRLLLEGERDVALRFATAHVQQLCTTQTSLSPSSIKKITQIVHLLLHAKYGCPSYTEGRQTLMAFLRIHPNLKPVPETLFILLQNLHKANRRSFRAYEALKWFRKRWPDVEDESVRRAVAKFALQGKSKEGMVIAKEMAQREAELGTRWRIPSTYHQDLSHARARAFGEVYTRENRDKQEWIRMGLITRKGGFHLAKDHITRERRDGERAGEVPKTRAGEVPKTRTEGGRRDEE